LGFASVVDALVGVTLTAAFLVLVLVAHGVVVDVAAVVFALGILGLGARAWTTRRSSSSGGR
jgi:hypothetical protein